ncbi:MAG: hypothetical protein COB98_07275 [Flavobacteriaceae bacterium]|nr:MAG: hypothetical protein COB98_07275 [Flavobacteriaceae bacterium]
MNNITYSEINSNQKQVLVKTFFGDFSVVEIINVWKSDIATGKLRTAHSGAILDFTNATLRMNLSSDIAKLVSYLESVPAYFNGFKFAVIMHTPSQVTIPYVVERTNNSFKSKTFYTLEAGKQWILK